MTANIFARLRRTALSLNFGAGEKLGNALDDARLQALDRALVEADVGPKASRRILEKLREARFSGSEAELQGAVLKEKIQSLLAEIIASELRAYARPLQIDSAHRPHVILASGVNGGGKTTSLGKFAALLKGDGHSVLLAAGDTFRAAAIDQLRVWAERAGVAIEEGEVGMDAAALAYGALHRAREEGFDVLLIDTAGRLQNRGDLMAQTEKMLRVLRKLDESAPHDSLLVLDGTVGQNALSQVRAFREVAEVSGLIVTKLDGAAKGGVLLALCEEGGLPIHYVGLGEGIGDLHPFDADAFARALAGGAG